MKNRTGFIRLAFAMTIFISFVAGVPLCFSEPVPGGPGFVSVGAFAFKPFVPSVTYSYINNRLYNSTGSIAGFYTPVQLPHGATITKVILYFVDNGDNEISLFLTSYPLDEPATLNRIAQMTTSGASASQQTLVTNTFPHGNVVDNQSNFYTVSCGLPPGSNYAIGGVRVDYSYPTSLPLVTK